MGLHFAVRSLALAAALIGLNAMASDSTAFFVSRIDMTSERLHTLSSTTIETIESAEEKEREIAIVAYLSPDVPQQFVHTRKQLVSLLRQYDRIGGTTLDVQFVNVNPNSQEARNARNDGVEPRRLTSEVAGKQVEQDVYLGVVLKSDAGEMAIPFLDGETALEYELTRALSTVTVRPERLKVGILQTDGLSLEPPSGGQPMRDFYSDVLGELEQHYKLVHVSPFQLSEYLPDEEDEKDDENASEAATPQVEDDTVTDDDAAKTVEPADDDTDMATTEDEAAKTDTDDDSAEPSDCDDAPGDDNDTASSSESDATTDDSDTEGAEDTDEGDSDAADDETAEDDTVDEGATEKEATDDEATDDEATDDEATDYEATDDEATDDEATDDDGEEEEDAEEEDPQDAAPDVLIVVQPSTLTKDVMDDLIRYIELGNAVLLLDDPLPFFPFVWYGPEDIGIVNAPAQERPSPRSNLAWASVAPERPMTEFEQHMQFQQQLVQMQMQQQLQNLPPQARMQMQSQMMQRMQQQLQMAAFQYLDEHPEHAPRFETKVYPTDDELEILKVLWDRGPSELKEIHEAIVERRGEPIDEAVIRGLLLIMKDKEFVKSDKEEEDNAIGAPPMDEEEPEMFQAAIARSMSKMKLMQRLGLEWNHGRVVTDLFDPHPEFVPTIHPRLGESWPRGYGKRENLLVFVSPGNGAEDAFSTQDSIAAGLQRMLFFYPGTVRKADDSKLTFAPIISTGPDSALIPWDELTYGEVDRSERFDHVSGQMVRSAAPQQSQWTDRPLRRLAENPTAQSDKASQVIAAHVTSDGDNPVNVVFVADIDFITDYYFMQLERLEKRADNLTFLHNAIEVLAGDDSLVSLRSRRAKPRQLTAIQDEIDKYRRERAAEQQKIEEEIAAKIKEADEELKKKQEEIGNEATSLSEVFVKMEALGEAQSAYDKKIEKRKKQLNDDLRRTIDELKGDEQEKISRRETEARVWAVVLPPLPALLLGLIVLSVRVVNERRQVVESRRRS